MKGSYRTIIIWVLSCLLLGMGLGTGSGSALAEGGANAGITGAVYPAAMAEPEPDSPDLERFDVKKGKVTDRAVFTAELREEASLLVRSIGGYAETFRIDPQDGTVLRIPLKPSLEVRKPGFYAFATEVFLFLPLHGTPYILVFSEENEPRIFAVTHPVDRLLRLCGWEDARKK
jgi:hypothetical protein